MWTHRDTVDLLSALILVFFVAVPVILFGGPDWAAWGFGFTMFVIRMLGDE